MSYRWLEHASEVELRIDAPSEEAVFELAVSALNELVAVESESADGGVSPLDREIAVTALDRAALLAAFLEEIVYLIETEDLIPERAEHVVLEAGTLTATVHGHRGRPRHVVKGVTYHELTFARAGAGVVATVVLDV